MARAPNKGLTPELRRFADALSAAGVPASFSLSGRGGEPSSPRVKVRLRVDSGPPSVSRVVSLNTRRSPEQFVVVVDEYETDEDGVIDGPHELEHETARTIYEAEQIFAQLVAKYRGRKKGPVGERDERYRVPLPNPSGTTPFILQRSVVAIAEKNPCYSMTRVFAIATAASQRAGYLRKGTRDVTAKGRRKEHEYTAAQRATIERAYEKLVARRNPAARPIRAAKMIEAGFSEAVPGGVYIRPEKGVAPRDSEILNGRVYAGGFVDVSGPRPALYVSDEPATIPGMHGQKLSRVAGRFQVKVNLYRQSAGWEWESGARPTSDVEGSPALVSVESPNGHHYALRVEFETPVWLATYPKSKSEPRLRPTAMPGVMVVGEPVGTMVTTEKEHPVYDVIKLREPEPRAPRKARKRR